MSGPAALDLSGRLYIGIEHAGQAIARVTIRSSRPIEAARALQGRTPLEAVRLVPLVFSLCGGAQRVAAQIACERAQGLAPSPAAQVARDFALALERAREHALRLLVDWPAALGLPSERETAAQIFVLQRRLDSNANGDFQPMTDALRQFAALIRDAVLGERWEDYFEGGDSPQPPGRAILPRLLRALEINGWSALGGGASLPEPETFDTETWRRVLDAAPDSFAREPDIGGQPRETTPYTRQRGTALLASAERRWGDGLATRLLAQAAELHASLLNLESHSAPPNGAGTAKLHERSGTATGEGIGIVEAPRGRLIHRVTLVDGHVRHYRIVAPTEWNFHPRGVVARALARLPVASPAACATQARAVICAVDPCVPYDLDIRHHA